MAEKDSPEIALIDSITKLPVLDSLQELAEVALDAVLEKGLANDIPFFGSFAKLYSSVVTLRERAYLKKILKFLSKLEDIPDEQRAKWVKDLEEKDEKHKVGEALIMLLDRLDTMEKAEIVGKIYKTRIEGLIDQTTCQRLCAMVDRVYLADLYELAKGYPLYPSIRENLAAIGFMSPQGIEANVYEAINNANITSRSFNDVTFPLQLESALTSILAKAKTTYEINHFGRLLMEIAFNWRKTIGG